MIKQALAVISGKKTYLVMAAGILYVAAQWYVGNIMQDDAVNQILGFLGLGTLRAGVAKAS